MFRIKIHLKKKKEIEIVGINFNIYFDYISTIVSQRSWNTIKFKYPGYIKRHILKMARIRPLVNACHRVPYLRQCLPTISGVRQFSLLFAYSTSAYETHCRATGRWLGLLCFYTSLVISLCLSLAPSIPRPCCLRSSLAGRVKFTNPYGAPRATSAPVLSSHFKNPSCSFFSLVVFQSRVSPLFFIFLFFFFFFSFNSVLFIYLFPSSPADFFSSKFFYRIV